MIGGFGTLELGDGWGHGVGVNAHRCVAVC